MIIVIETFAGEDLNIIVSFIGYLGYPILGYYLNNKQIGRPTAGLVMMLVSLALIVYLHYTHSNLISLGYLSLPVLSIGLGAFVFIKNLPETGNATVKRTIESISISSYGMYFAHILLIKMFLMFALHLRFPATFAVIVFTSWLVTYVLGKIAYVKLFSGSMID